MIPPDENDTTSDEARARLNELLVYVEQVVRLDKQTVFRLNEYKLPAGETFVLHQHECRALPGIAHDLEDDDGSIWL